MYTVHLCTHNAYLKKPKYVRQEVNDYIEDVFVSVDIIYS